MERIDPNHVAKRYNALKTIIDDDDLWHLSTQKVISQFIRESMESLHEFNNLKILNAGSAGNAYGLSQENMMHVDVAGNHIEKSKSFLVADISNMPLNSNSFDFIICVGSVLNYCDPIAVLKEFSRVLKRGGYVILEFENSKTFELLFKTGFNKSATLIETFFDSHGDKEKIWYFSEKYIKKMVLSYNYRILSTKRFHLISPLLYRLTGNQDFSSKFISLDKIIKYIPWLNSYSSNVILFLKLGV
jgi:SAM-dependent methyltransferase